MTDWNNGIRTAELRPEISPSKIDVFVTDELVRSATISLEDGVWRAYYENGQKVQLAAIPKWRLI